MGAETEIKNLLKEIASENVMYPKLCTVISVDGNECVCEPKDGTVEITARIKAKTSINDGILIEPVIGSDVLVIFSEKGKLAFVAAYSQIKNIEFKMAQGGKIQISNDVQTLKSILNDLMQAIVNIKVVAPPTGGTTGPPLNAFDFLALNQRINLLLK